MRLRYQDPSISHDQAVSPLASGSETNIVAALVSIGLNEQDKTRAQTVCVEQLDVGTESVAALAVGALGHIK